MGRGYTLIFHWDLWTFGTREPNSDIKGHIVAMLRDERFIWRKNLIKDTHFVQNFIRSVLILVILSLLFFGSFSPLLYGQCHSLFTNNNKNVTSRILLQDWPTYHMSTCYRLQWCNPFTTLSSPDLCESQEPPWVWRHGYLVIAITTITIVTTITIINITIIIFIKMVTWLHRLNTVVDEVGE